MVFCNKILAFKEIKGKEGHNPYFNRWFSAIEYKGKLSDFNLKCHNPYFNRWFSAIRRQ